MFPVTILTAGYHETPTWWIKLVTMTIKKFGHVSENVLLPQNIEETHDYCKNFLLDLPSLQLLREFEVFTAQVYCHSSTDFSYDFGNYLT